MSSYLIPAGLDVPTYYAPGILEIVKLLRLMAGDPETVDRALFFETGTVTDTAVSGITRVQSQSENYSILMIQFAASSGSGRFNLMGNGDLPTAAGRGMPILAAGTLLTIRGVDNINNFRMIAETGQTMIYNALLFKAPMWSSQKP